MIQADAHLMLLDPLETRRDLLRTYLKRQGFLVSAARDCDHAARLLAGLEFDLILLDGADECEALCDLTHAPVLWMVAAGEERDGETLQKPFEPDTLVTTINTLLDRRPPPAKHEPLTLKLGALRYDVEQSVLREGDERVRLTATEIKLMRALAARPNAPVTRAELADEVGETDATSRAVDVQITRLRRKIERDPKLPKHLQTVRGTGYMLVTD